MDFDRSVDVLVAGGGVAGVAAALAAARAGQRVALVEKTIFFGGLATAGLVNIYLPLCDGNGTQVTFGIAEELLHASIRYGPGDVPASWRQAREAPEPQRYRTPFAPAAFALALDELLEDAGVELWLDTAVLRPRIEGRRVTALEVANKSGTGLLRAQCVIDATGDADVAVRAGAPCAQGQNWLSLWALQADRQRANEAAAKGSAEPLLDMVRLGGDDSGRGAPASRPWHGTTGQDVSEFVLATRRMLREHYAGQQSDLGERGRREVFPLTLPAMAQFRTTRRIEGQTTLTDGGHGEPAPDSIGLVADWRRPGRVWEIPLGALLPREVDGLLAAGRCISAAGDAWQVTRVIPAAALTGQAAGAAAALCAQHDTTPTHLDPSDLQSRLRTLGLPLRLADVGL
jgi:2-polyprenyl-6-methoxyphenol hydroxylase-like FAD-dependent oxidoreductase